MTVWGGAKQPSLKGTSFRLCFASPFMRNLRSSFLTISMAFLLFSLTSVDFSHFNHFLFCSVKNAGIMRAPKPTPNPEIPKTTPRASSKSSRELLPSLLRHKSGAQRKLFRKKLVQMNSILFWVGFPSVIY